MDVKLKQVLGCYSSTLNGSNFQEKTAEIHNTKLKQNLSDAINAYIKCKWCTLW